MNYYFITGSSKGLGSSIVDLLLNKENNAVYGMARTQTKKHERYVHTKIDLGKTDKVLNYEFPELKDAEKIVLINNAGIVGDIKHVGNVDNQKIIDCYNVNLIAPVIMTNNFMSKYSSLECKKTVLNISSGAGQSPIDGWNVYCSSKAGIDMFSRVLSEEVMIDNSEVKVLSLAPGIVDTGMQNQIRTAGESDFSNVERFVEYKKSGELASAELTASKVLRFLNEDDLATGVVCSVRDLSE